MDSKEPSSPRLVSEPAIDRRSFVKGISAASLGIAAGSSTLVAAVAETRKRRYAIVGTGSRHSMYRDAILDHYQDHAVLVGLCDINAGRLELSASESLKRGTKVPTYAPQDFEKMLRENKVDIVIETTVDATHDDYIIRGLEAGCDVITEKPMTTTAEKCQNILDAQKRSGRKVRVTFN
jgi:predicted dehydrogenase